MGRQATEEQISNDTDTSDDELKVEKHTQTSNQVPEKALGTTQIPIVEVP